MRFTERGVAQRWWRLVVAAALVGANVVLPTVEASAEVGPSVVSVAPSGGVLFGGMRATLRGSGLADVREVRFGATPAPWLERRSDSEVVAEVPPGEPGLVDVTVVVPGPGGEVVSSPGPGAGFTYWAETWSGTDPLKLPRSSHTATPLTDGQVLLVGGQVRPRFGGDVEATMSVQRFDPLALNAADGRGQWKAAAGLRNRLGHTATRLSDGGVLVAGGAEELSGAFVAVPAVYDSQKDAWSSVAAMAKPRRHHSATLLVDGTVLVAGGLDDARWLASAEVFDPRSGVWTTVPSMGARAFSDGVTTAGSDTLTSLSASFTPEDLGNELHGPNIPAGTRILQLASPTSVKLSHAATDSGSELGFTFNIARSEHTATLLPDGSVLLAGGRGAFGQPLGTVERYVPAAGVPAGGGWVPAPRLEAARTRHTATALGDGRVIVAGGVGRDQVLASVEVYDPAVDHWSPGGSMGRSRLDHTAALLDNGKVLVAGGFGPDPATLASAELYELSAPGDVDSGRWIPTSPMSVGRSRFTATLLHGPACAPVAGLCGRVLVVGDDPQGRTELFDPAPSRPPPSIARLSPDNAPTMGGAVTIAGDNLRGATSVTFGTTPVAFQVVSNQQITTTSPPHAVGRVDVTVTTPAGSSLTPSRTSHFDYGPGAWSASPQPPACLGPCSYEAATPLLDGRVLVTRGDGTAVTFDPETTQWTATGPMTTRHGDGLQGVPAPTATFTATRLGDGRVLVAGGCCTFGTGPGVSLPNSHASAEIFDPLSSTWQPVPPMRTPRIAHAAVLLADGTRVLVLGGTTDQVEDRVSATAEIFDSVRGTWSDAPHMSVTRSHATANLLPNGQVLVAGGRGYQLGAVACHAAPYEYLCPQLPQARVELYTPDAVSGGAGTWALGPDLPNHRSSHTATSLPNGSVLVAGGVGQPHGADATGTAVYDPVPGSWSAVGRMATNRADHTATLLPSGKVLVAGGHTTGSPSAEVFDLATGQWSLTTSLRADRWHHAATVMGDGAAACRERPRRDPATIARLCGSVLVVGGYTIDARPFARGTPLGSAEVYTPAPQVDAVAPARGPAVGGTRIVISGSGFAGASGASFGDVRVTTSPCAVSPGPGGCFTVVSPTRIMAVTPAHPTGPAIVGVAGPGGISGLVVPGGSAQQFDYIGRPP